MSDLREPCSKCGFSGPGTEGMGTHSCYPSALQAWLARKAYWLDVLRTNHPEDATRLLGPRLRPIGTTAIE